MTETFFFFFFYKRRARVLNWFQNFETGGRPNSLKSASHFTIDNLPVRQMLWFSLSLSLSHKS